MSWRVDRAEELRTEARSLITASSLTDKVKVTVTSDANDIDRTPDIAAGVVVIAPAPRLSWPNPTIEVAQWSIAIIAGPADQLLGAWERIDALLDVLQPMFLTPNAEAVPGELTRPDGSLLPGYTITFPEHSQS